ncbi:tetratricopeptide repeat protein [Haloferula sp.]|uniref:tetratricopeptide repeat protein n=1 Tax=Haloferula sp. TaxID=2497595 RepID=UPI003C72FB36
MNSGLRLALIGAIFQLALGISQAAEIPDGSWNGKSWERERLDAGVKNGDPEALAEWAYCARIGQLGIPYDEELIFSYAKQSSDAGNSYGMAILSKCHLAGTGTEKNTELGFKLAQASADAGHPLGLKNVATCYLQGEGVPRDYDQGNQMTKKSMDQGCVIAAQNRALQLYQGICGNPRNREKGLQILTQSFRDFRDSNTARIIISFVPEDPTGKKVPLDIQDGLVECLRTAHQCGVPGVTAILGQYLCLNGRGNEGIPLVIEACEAPDDIAHEVAVIFSNGLKASEKAGAVGHYATLFRLSREAAELGSESINILRFASDSYLYKWGGTKPNPEKAVPYVLKLAERGYYQAHGSLGRIYFSNTDSKIRDNRRGIAHLVYGSSFDPGALHYLAEAFIIGRPEDHDFVRGYAAAAATVGRRQGTPREKADRILNLARKELNDEQMEEAQELIDQGYPTAEKFRRPAFETLKEYGDLPKSAKFKKAPR